MTRSLIIIPARLASTRLPRKVLLQIAGKPMLQHCWELACAAAVAEVLIATEDEEIVQAAGEFGAAVLKTSSHDSGTARIAEAAELLGLAGNDLVINLQADEPLLPPDVLHSLHATALQYQAAACSVCSPLLDPAQLTDQDIVKVVLSQASKALYFSRAAIPFARGLSAAECADQSAACVHHGVYAYRVQTLRQWSSLPRGALERAERLEQLRLLENGLDIHMLKLTRPVPGGVDNAADLQQVRELFANSR